MMTEMLLETFPARINDGSTRNNINLVQRISTANLLDQRVLTITDNFEINVGKKIRLPLELIMNLHSLKMYFSEITLVLTHFVVFDFLLDRKPITFAMNYSLIGGEGDGSLEQLNLGQNNLVLCPK
jgi:hypothetical protein